MLSYRVTNSTPGGWWHLYKMTGCSSKTLKGTSKSYVNTKTFLFSWYSSNSNYPWPTMYKNTLHNEYFVICSLINFLLQSETTSIPCYVCYVWMGALSSQTENFIFCHRDSLKNATFSKLYWVTYTRITLLKLTFKVPESGRWFQCSLRFVSISSKPTSSLTILQYRKRHLGGR